MSQTADATTATATAFSTADETRGGTQANGKGRSLRQSVEQAVDNYFEQLDGQIVTDVYDLVLQEVEAPLLEVVLKHTRNNQTLAATVLGLNRGTLRKKLKRYGLL